MKETEKANVNNNLLVGAGKSSRLVAMRKKAGIAINNTGLDEKQNRQQFVTGLNQQTKDALQLAGIGIEERITLIMNGFPAGKKNTFFKLKYGVDVGKVQEMAMKQVFALLNLDIKQNRHFRLIENLDVNGNRVDD